MPALALLLAAYFLWFARDALRAGWAADDMMNLYGAWQPGWWDLLLAQFRPWHGDYRPLGGLFYVTLYELFGLNPFPFRVGILLLLGGNVWLTWRLARRLGCDEVRAALAAVVVAYHAGLGSLNYSIDVIYDILCFTFYIGALVYYLGIRRGGTPGPRQTAVLFALYLCALNSKEMALTLPLALLAYEAIYHPAAALRWKELRRWLAGPPRLAFFAAAFNLVYLYGKKYGPDPMMGMPGYQPVFSLARFGAFNGASLAQLAFRGGPIGTLGLLTCFTVITWLAWRYNRPALRFCWAFALIAPLPIEFLVGRYQSCLYIPLAGWAIFAAIVLADLAEGIADFARGALRLRFLPRAEVVAVVLVCALIPWVRLNRKRQALYVRPNMLAQAPLTVKAIQDFRSLKGRIRPHSRLVFLDDPFPGFDIVFITSLTLGDRSVDVWMQRIAHLPASEIAKFDYRFTFDAAGLRRLP